MCSENGATTGDPWVPGGYTKIRTEMVVPGNFKVGGSSKNSLRSTSSDSADDNLNHGWVLLE